MSGYLFQNPPATNSSCPALSSPRKAIPCCCKAFLRGRVFCGRWLPTTISMIGLVQIWGIAVLPICWISIAVFLNIFFKKSDHVFRGCFPLRLVWFQFDCSPFQIRYLFISEFPIILICYQNVSQTEIICFIGRSPAVVSIQLSVPRCKKAELATESEHLLVDEHYVQA